MRPTPRTWRIAILTTWITATYAVVGLAETTITLNNTFIEKYKDRVTIDTHFIVDKAAKNPHRAAEDGDLHVAGRADEVQLPMVAEIQNAKFYRPAIDVIHESEGGDPIKLTGVWRIWAEHADDGDQVQGDDVAPIKKTNPPHVFEVHPVTNLKEISLLSSLKPIEGYRTKEADAAFTKYENIPCEITTSPTTTTITTRMAGYNHVEFILELNEDDQKVVEDGRFVMCQVHDLDGELIAHNRRMVFVKGSEPEKRVATLKKGGRLHVVALPRLDLALVSWRVRHAPTKPEVLKWRFPYELIVIGVYDETPESDEE
jgi:hypothetical protein